MQKYIKKGIKRDKSRIGVAYINKPHLNQKYPSSNRSNSHLNRAKKSVSIVSLSPNENLNYGKEMILYNPYHKAPGNKKIHLPYLKNRRAVPRVRHDSRHVKPRGDKSVKNGSFEGD